MNSVEVNGNSFYLYIRAKTNRKETEIMSIDIDFVYMSVAAVPDKEKANKELIRFFENLFNVPKGGVTIESGIHSFKKRIKITGVLQKKIF